MTPDYNHSERLPWRIWTFWSQGFDGAPDVVKACIRSWVLHNPKWQIELLDATNINDFITVDTSSTWWNRLSRNHQSDLIRLDLLSQYGGVWVDATAFCTRPLDDWLPTRMNSGFFAFSAPGRGRLLASWFLASKPRHPLVVEWRDRLARHWSICNSNVSNPSKNLLLRMFGFLLNRNIWTSRWWFSWPMARVLRIYPYYTLHYIFNWLVQSDKNLREIWEQSDSMSARESLTLLSQDSCNQSNDLSFRHITSCRAPVYKLSWKKGAWPK